VVLDFRFAGQLDGAFLEECQRAVVDAPPVEDPAGRVGDLRAVRRQLRGGLGEGGRLIELPEAA
jgi:hypothetical protein